MLSKKPRTVIVILLLIFSFQFIRAQSIKGDLNNDGKVNVIDLGILLSSWGRVDRPPADLNQDGKVDVIDLGILLSNWGKTTTTTSTTVPTTSTPFAMAFFIIDDPNKICDYPVIFTTGKNLKDFSGQFDPTILEKAKSCGTKIIIALNERTENIVGENGGINLTKFRERVSFFDGKIEPYINSGVIIAHAVVDEPHDCVNDWKGICPTAKEVDEAAAISKEYWPNLPTVVNTIPSYLSKEGYIWKNNDIIMFQYAYHKGDLNNFVNSAVNLKKQGLFRKLAWSMQVKSGGCPQYQGCSMSPDQVKTVASTMCTASKGEWIAFASYDKTLLETPGMVDAINYVQTIC